MSEQAKKLQILKRATAILLATAIVAFLAVFFCFIPFRLLLPATALSARKEGELRIHFIALADGDCTAVEFPDGEVLLINAGGGSFTSDNLLSKYLRGIKPTKLSALATGTEIACVGGMASILRLAHLENVYFPAFTAETSAWNNFVEEAAKQPCNAVKMKRYNVVSNPSGAYLVCISPYSEESVSNPKDASVAMFLSYSGVNVLLAGDMSAARERTIVSEYETDSEVFNVDGYAVALNEVDILGVSSHGADSASCAEFLSLIKPEKAVISCSASRLPAGETLARLSEANAEIFRTDELETVCVSIQNGAYRIYGHYAK